MFVRLNLIKFCGGLLKMKVFFGFLLVLIAGAQATQVSSRLTGGALANPGENPWVVYIRTTVNNNGFLNSCMGTLIDRRWVLTAASCLNNARFIWTRYGVVNTLTPRLVIEGGSIRLNPSWNQLTGENNIALLGLTRNIGFTGYINPIRISSGNTLEATSTKFCSFGAIETVFGATLLAEPGEEMKCIDVSLEQNNNAITATSTQGKASRFDIGAPLVVNNQLIGVLSNFPSSSSNLAGVFLRPSQYITWINSESGLSL